MIIYVEVVDIRDRYATDGEEGIYLLNPYLAHAPRSTFHTGERHEEAKSLHYRSAAQCGAFHKGHREKNIPGEKCS